MPLDFPTSPTLDEVYTFGGRSWKWNGTAWDSYNPDAENVVDSLNGITGAVTLAAGSNITLTPVGTTITIASSGGGGGGISGPYVISFNGLTGAVTGVASIRGLSGDIGLTNGSGIGLSVSGNTLTVSNTGILSFNGLTGDVTGVTTGTANIFGPLQSFTNGISSAGATFSALTRFTAGISASGGMTLGGVLNGATAIFSNRISTAVLGAGSIVPYGKSSIDIAQEANARVYIGDLAVQGQGTYIAVDDVAPYTEINQSFGVVAIGDLLELNNSNYLSVDGNAQSTGNAFIFSASGSQPVNIRSNLVLLTNTQVFGLLETTGGISAAGGTFSALTRFTAGISASGGATLSGNVNIPSGSTLTINGNFVANGNVNLGDAVTDAITVTGLLAANGGLSAAGGTFSALTRFTAGISASGATLSSNITIPSGSTLSISGVVSSDNGYRISSSAINAQTGTTYTLLATDNGEIITFNNGSAITVTVPTGLTVGFNCTAIQLGAGQVGFTAASGVTLNSYSSALKIAGQHGSASILSYASNIYNLSGSLNP